MATMTELVYDDGGEVRRLKGTITKRTSLFVMMETQYKLMRIYNRVIIKEEENKIPKTNNQGEDQNDR